MTEDDNYINTLMNLGLTLLQAKMYLTLTKLRKANAKTISKASSVARPDVYRVMPALEKLGLAEKILSKTTMYKATPIKEAFSILLQNRKQEYAEIEKKISSLLNNCHTVDLQDFQEEDQQFKITSEMTLLLKTRQRLIQSAQASIDMAVPWKVAQKTLLDHSYHKKAKKGIKIRVITQKVGEKTPPIKLQALAKSSGIEFKYLSNSAPFGMHIFDKKEVTLSMSEKEGLPCLWSNNHNVVKLAEGYFENMWNNAEIN